MILDKVILYFKSNDTPFGLLRDPSGRPLFLLCVIPMRCRLAVSDLSQGTFISFAYIMPGHIIIITLG